MTRIDFRPWLGIAACVSVLGYVGCSSSSPPRSSSPLPSATATATDSSGGAAGAKGEPARGGGKPATSGKPLANLGDPAAVLIVSGEQDGYLEPCGCTEGQAGGLLRRYDLVERLHNQNHWPTALIDLGSLVKNPAIARGGFEQAKIKFDYALRALKLLNYSALALSVEDLRVGVGEALGLLLNGLGDTTKVVVANVQPATGAGYETIFRTSVLVKAGPVTLGVTAVLDPEALQKLADPDKDVLLPTVKRPDDVLPGVLAELEPQSDFQVLMVQGPPALAKRLAEAYPGFDIVVATSEFVDVLKHDAELLNGGKTMLVSVGKKGKYVGVFGLYPNKPERLRYQIVTLDTMFNGPATPMKKLVEEEFRGQLRQIGVVENYVRRDYVNGAPGATFVGAESCKSCHPKSHEKWASTGHAQAYDALLNDPKPDTIHDAECISCHTTGFEYNSGWRSEALTPHLEANGCENCHGPGSKHIAEPDNVEFRKAMAVSAEQADKNGLCNSCHDLDNSPHFEFAAYYKKIDHKGLDTYNDPKVHRGVAPKVAATATAPVVAAPEPNPRKQ